MPTMTGKEFYDDISRRLGLPEELQTDADVRLADAYIDCLAECEDGETNPFLLWQPEELAGENRISVLEAAVVMFMARLEYVGSPFHDLVRHNITR